MRFYIPSDIYVEKNCVLNHRQDIIAMGKRAYIVTGRHSARVNGSLDDVLTVLTEAGISYEIFDEVEENPSVETIVKAAEIGRDFQADYVIGIGGGSPLDASKAIALLIANPEEDGSCLYETRKLDHLPLVAIPTTCGTGSEATPVSVLTNHAKKMKKSIPYKIFPALSLVDGKYLASARKSLIVNTAVDALAHMIESYLNSKSNLYNRLFPEYGMKLWARNKDALLSEEPFNESQYELLMLVSTIAGMAIAHTGTGLPHGMSYDLTYHYNVPHGPACGYFLGAYMEVCSRQCPEDVNKILDLLEMKDLDEFSAYIRSLIGTYEIDREAKETFIAAMEHNEGKLSAAPCPVAPEDVRYIYDKSLITR